MFGINLFIYQLNIFVMCHIKAVDVIQWVYSQLHPEVHIKNCEKKKIILL